MYRGILRIHVEKVMYNDLSSLIPAEQPETVGVERPNKIPADKDNEDFKVTVFYQFVMIISYLVKNYKNMS